MSETPTDPRVLAARESFEIAKRRLDTVRGELLRTYGLVLKEHNLEPDSAVVDPNGWDCEKSPVGKCVYDFYEDPCRDSCLFCGDPEERK